MLRRIIAALISFFAPLVVCPAMFAGPARALTPTDLYCSGIVSRTAPRSVGFVDSGDNASGGRLFVQGDDVYLHVADSSGLRIGGQFLVVRAAKDPIGVPWFAGEGAIEKRMGRLWEDIGRVRVVKLAGSVPIARIESSCTPMERGDLLLPFRARLLPSLPTAQPKITSTTAPSGATGRVVSAKDFHQVLGAGSIAYVDLGTRQDAKVGDRLLLFRYAGAAGSELSDTQATTQIGGFGHSALRHRPRQLPREILGEAVVLRVSPTAATILITASRREIELGNFAEIE